jgi:hypothetical protein
VKKIKCFGYREAGLVGIREVRVQRGDAEGAEISAEKTVGGCSGENENVTLTRRRGVAEIVRGEEEDQNERGDSGGVVSLRTERV